jgi:O-antigen/teichoic acid export membrane protein
MEPTSTGAVVARDSWIRRVATIGGRYGIATIGPLSVSGANFVASLALLRTLPPAHFGLFAFILVFIGFCFSLSNALIVTPYTVAANQRGFGPEEKRTYFKANLLFSLLAGLVCGGLALAMHAGGSETAVLFGLFGGLLMLRWFARAHSYAMHEPIRVAAVDIVYTTLVLSGLAVTWIIHDLNLDTALLTFVCAGTASVAASGNSYLKMQFIEALTGRLRGYASIWHNQSRWTLLGVASTEATMNTHAYLVTLIAGPAAFAPIAAATLFMKPIAMCANSLTQLERPAMARAIAAGDLGEALRRTRHYRWAIMLVWLITVTAAAVILIWFPRLILSESYDLTIVITATVLWACIEGIQSWLVPDAALLQAADRFRLLASVTVRSCIVTIIVVFLLLVFVSPVASLGGVLAGEIILACSFAAFRRAWRSGHV